MDFQSIRELTTDEPVTLAELKVYLRITNDQEDALLNSIITNARLQAERYLRSDIVAKERQFYLNEVTKPVNMPYAPLNIERSGTGTILNFTVTIEDGDATLVEGEGYEIQGFDNGNPKILIGRLQDSFRRFGHRNERLPARKVRFTYETKGIEYDLVKNGVLALCAWMYDRGESGMMTNWKSWLNPYKIKSYYGTA